MNFDVKRQAMNNSGNLFDINGPTSLGELPRGEIKPRFDNIIITSPVTPNNGHSFMIGSAPRTPLMPDEWFERGNEELKKRNLAALRDHGSGNRFGTGSDEITAPKINVKVAEVPTSIAGSGGQEE